MNCCIASSEKATAPAGEGVEAVEAVEALESVGAVWSMFLILLFHRGQVTPWTNVEQSGRRRVAAAGGRGRGGAERAGGGRAGGGTVFL